MQTPIKKDNQYSQENEPKKKKNELKFCSWNIRKGLVIREQELIHIVSVNSIDIIFLVETDTESVNEEKDYKIQGFKTLVQNKKSSTTPTRIICLISEKLRNSSIIRMDLTAKGFPSLWVEIENQTGKKHNHRGILQRMGSWRSKISPGPSRSNATVYHEG